MINDKIKAKQMECEGGKGLVILRIERDDRIKGRRLQNRYNRTNHGKGRCRRLRSKKMQMSSSKKEQF